MTTVYHPRPQRWPQVSLKGFFVLVTVLGVLFGWLAVQAKWIRDRHEALRWIESSGVLQQYGGPRYYGQVVISWNSDRRTTIPWSLRIFGETGILILRVPYPPSATDPYDPAELQALFPEATIMRPS